MIIMIIVLIFIVMMGIVLFVIEFDDYYVDVDC